MAYWKPIRGLMEPVSIRQFRGVYNNDDGGFNLAEGFAQDMRNLSSGKYPALSTRPGYISFGTLTGRVTGLGVWQGQELHAIANGVWSKWISGTTWQVVTGGTGLSTSADCSFANFKGNLSAINLIMANGTDPIKRYDGTTVQNLTGAPVGGNFIEQHDNRLYCAVGNTISFSALSKADDWSTAKDAGQIVLETNNGQQIVGMKAGNQHLTIFKNSSIHELFGTGPNNFRLIEVANDIGAYCHKGIVNSQGILYFISTRIYQYGGGSKPDATFSKPVQKYVDGINFTSRNKCVAGTNGKNIYFAIPYGSSATECNMILEYDTQYGVWFVWDGLTTTALSRFMDAFMHGDTLGMVAQLGAGYGENGIPTPWKWVSPPYGAGTLAKRTNWYNMWFLADVPAGSSLNVYISKSASGDSDWILLKSIASQTGVQNARIIIPLATVALSNFIRVKIEGAGPVTIYEFDRQMREMPLK